MFLDNMQIINEQWQGDSYRPILEQNFNSNINPDQDPNQSQEVPSEPPEYEPLKKIFLIGKLNRLRTTLMQNDLSVETLDFILKFCKDLGYPILVNLTNSLIDIVNVQLQDQDRGKHVKTKK